MILLGIRTQGSSFSRFYSRFWDYIFLVKSAPIRALSLHLALTILTKINWQVTWAFLLSLKFLFSGIIKLVPASVWFLFDLRVVLHCRLMPQHLAWISVYEPFARSHGFFYRYWLLVDKLGPCVAFLKSHAFVATFQMRKSDHCLFIGRLVKILLVE